MADEKIQIQADIDIEPSIAKLRQLKKELRNITDPEEFKRVTQQIDDMQEAIKAGQVGAGNFAEVLGTLPGPIGDIAGRAGGLIGSLKQFGQIKLTDIKGSFVELGKDLVDAAKGIGNLTGITKVYAAINNTLAKSFVAIGVAEGTAAAGARAFAAALTATGIGAIVVAIGLAASALMDLTTELYKNVTGQKELERATKATNDAIERQNTLFDLDAKAAENRRKVTIAQMKAAGKTEKEIRDFQIKSAYDDYTAAYAAEQEAAKIANQAQGKADAEAFKKAQDNFDKAQQRRKDAYATYLETGYNARAADLADQKANQAKSNQLAEQDAAKRKALRDKELSELTAGQREAFLTTLSEKEKEEFVINEKYQNLIHLATKYGQDTTVLKKAQQKELNAVTTKFNQQEYETEVKNLELRNAKGLLTEEEYQQSLYDLAVKFEVNTKDALIKFEDFKTQKRKQSAADAREILAMELQDKFDALDSENDRYNYDFEQDLLRFTEQRNLLAQQEANELANTELTELQRTEIRQKYAAKRKEITDGEIATEEAATNAKLAIQQQYIDLYGQFGQLLGQIAGRNKTIAIAGLLIEKGAAIAKIITQMNTVPPILPPGIPNPAFIPSRIGGALSIASVIAASVKGIQQINQAGAGVGIGGGGGGSAASAGTPPSFNAPTAISAPQVQTGVGATPGQQLADTLSRVTQRPIVAQVVSTAVSSQQALDRRTNGAATFGGG